MGHPPALDEPLGSVGLQAQGEQDGEHMIEVQRARGDIR